MTDAQLSKRIVFNPKVLRGKPVIKGTRISVELVLKSLAHGATHEEIMKDYLLKKEDIQACLLFAMHSLESMSFAPLYQEIA